MNAKIYHDDAASLADLSKCRVAVIGYGIQGSAFASNLRDSGIETCVGNIEDDYFERAVADGQRVFDISSAVAQSDVYILLIPDEAHREVFVEHIVPNHRPGSTLIVAHGFSVTQRSVHGLPDLDLAMLAPRMYGDPIRKYYLAGQGAPAYIDIIENPSGKAQARTLAIARAVGFTRAGVMQLDHKQETMLDLFQEQFLAPALVDLIETGFDVLVAQGFDPRAALLELYGSGEMGKMLLDGAEHGLDEVIEKQGSPTCQVGYHLYRRQSLPRAFITEQAERIIASIKNGDFAQILSQYATEQYRTLDTNRKACRKRLMGQTQREVRQLFNFPSENQDGLYKIRQAEPVI